MKGFFKPFWIKETQISTEQKFLDNSYTGHTNNNIADQTQPINQSRND